MKEYLEASEYIDCDHPEIITLAKKLAENKRGDVGIAKNCFEWVRDEIKHSWDLKINKVTCKASEVLQHGTGYCYAKSHLLAALLRANNIPAGLCYQRLSIYDDGAPYSLHGLNTVYLKDFGWYRVDARGNKKGINAQFLPPHEQLAFSINEDNEIDFSEVLVKPNAMVVGVLTKYQNIKDVFNNLPDAIKL
ncbi:MAG: transglutaminase family protein [Woeseiaceae bacterium]